MNALFLPESFFTDTRRNLASIKVQWQPFEKGLCIVDSNNEASGIYESRVVEAYRVGSAWVYLCAFYQIVLNVRESLEQMRIPPPITLVLREIAIDPRGIMRGRNVADGTPVVLFQADHPEPRAVFEQFQAELASVDPMALWAYQTSLARDVEKEKVRYRCEYWGRND